MRRDRQADDAVVEVNFAAGTLKEESRRPATEELTFADLVRALFAARWLVGGFALAALALGFAYVLHAVPLYETAALLQIEETSPTLHGLEDLSEIIGHTTSPAETEIEIIRSRTLIGSVVDGLRLDLRAEPRRAPLIGRAIARRWKGDGPAPARFGLGKYAWGGERIRLAELRVPDRLLDQPLVLTALEGGRYRLAEREGGQLLEGRVGQRVGGDGAAVEIDVDELVARPGTEFVVVRSERGGVVTAVREVLRAYETTRKSGVLVARFQDTSPERAAATLNAIAQAYLRRNVERKSAEAAQMLGFLESQLPHLKENVDKAELAMNEYQRDKRTLDLSHEAQGMLEQSIRIETALQELQMQATDLRQRFTSSHPAVVAAQEKIAKVKAERAGLEEQMRGLPKRELESARLARDVTVASELYVLVLNKAQELKVARSGVVGNVTVLDPAEIPRSPARPRPLLVLSLALLLGLGAGVAAALARRALTEGADDPDEIEARTGLPVFVMVPHSDTEGRLDREARRVPGAFRTALAEAAPDDLAVEGLRSLRTALQFALVEARNNVIALGAPAPAVGKSFVSVNLAHLLAAAGRRVLLVDGDLRRGRLHRYFSLERTPGLSDAVSGTVPLEQALRRTGIERLDVLSTGRIPPNPAELLASHRFQQLLASVSERYDLVLVDTPPVLAVTDPALVARLASVNLLVLRAGAHSIAEIAQAAKHLAQAGVKLQGAILNEVQGTRGGRYGRGGRYYRYDYRSDAS
ncbi:polysaccharide biosynthesis tyrosine autokinase [Anaeromyxobacter sp. Fw109-5]|uniref:polysaccharide biosynthesis tyrosine autokinase n=1 Tax=Anaeromyxobacter sp. (strain Fw109-5) TaxID=404589 RepID=UPI0000ED8025|nr:polysaccharide biosynthesis tyrosine autokinase [Anaeromyxobacter sp. Fw109-5]ABS25459.1 Non-specific protein-tyrosine kinase [Anaeromyxobacter sp. Fw109-5]